MKNRFKLFACFLLIASCKYDNGPLFSLSSPANRVVGNYSIESATEDGIDQMNKLNTLHIKTLDFGSEIPPWGGYDMAVTYADTTSVNFSGWWLINDDADINIYNTCSINGNYPDPSFAPIPGLLAD